MSVLAKYYKYKGPARTTLFFIGLLFIMILAKESWGEISGLIGQIKLGGFISSVILAVFGNVTMAILFNRLLGKHGVRISDLLALKMYMVGQIAKYIPGKIWGMAYQITHVAEMSGATGIVLANMEMMLDVMFMTSIVAVILLCILTSKLVAFIIILLGMAGFVFLYKTNIVNRIARLLPGKFKAIEYLAGMKCGQTSFSAGIAFYLIFCLVYVFSYLLMLDAVFGFSFEESVIYIVLLSAAWIGGVFALVVPAGMGVRELLFIVASSYVVPQHSVEMLTSIAILSRFWQIIQEIVGVSLLMFIRR